MTERVTCDYERSAYELRKGVRSWSGPSRQDDHVTRVKDRGPEPVFAAHWLTRRVGFSGRPPLTAVSSTKIPGRSDLGLLGVLEW